MNFKGWAFSRIYGHVQQNLNLDTAVRFADHDFLLECKILAIWPRLYAEF